MYNDSFIFQTESGEMFRSNYSVDENGNLGIQDTRLPVERVIEFKTTNPTDTNEDNAMRDSIIAYLANQGITVNADISDDDLMAKYNEALVANQGDNNADGQGDIAEIVNNAVSSAMKPLNEKIDGLESQLQANSNQELEELAQFVVNSKKRPEFDLEGLKALGINTVRNIAANCGHSTGIGSTAHINDDQDSEFTVNTDVSELPE